MNALQRTLRGLDRFQQEHRWAAFPVAVVKKYSEDEAGSKAALLTYYGFLSLFPLLLVLTTVTNGLIGSDQELKAKVIHGLTGYFPLLGNQLSEHVHGLHNNNLAVAAGVLFTFYGARGVAEAFRKGVQHVWQVPMSKREGFPQSLIKSLYLLLVGGVGFITASILAGLASAAGHSWTFRVLSTAIDLFILFWVFNLLMDLSLPRRLPRKDTRTGAAAAAVGLVVLQSLGGYLLSRELKHLDVLYSYFALALGLIFWIYLQTQILYYAMEIAFVSSHHLWPRSLDGGLPTEIDKKLAVRKSASQ